LLLEQASSSAGSRAAHAALVLRSFAVESRIFVMSQISHEINEEAWLLAFQEFWAASPDALIDTEPNKQKVAYRGAKWSYSLRELEMKHFHTHSSQCIPYHLAWAWIAAVRHAAASVAKSKIRMLSFAQGALRNIGFILADERQPKNKSHQMIADCCNGSAAAMVSILESTLRLLL